MPRLVSPEHQDLTPGPIDTAFEHAALRDSLAQAGAVVTAAELHGGVCAALSAGGPIAGVRWLATCLGDEDLEASAELETSLRDLLDTSWRMLESDDLAFAPFLPDDDDPLEEQVQALASWCQGFLGGLGTSAPDAPELRPAQTGTNGEQSGVTEILVDFAQISRAGLSEEEAAGRDPADFALAELIEYVRVGVLLVFEELAAHRAQRTAEH